MIYRTLVASFVVLGFALLFAPVEASARAGGFAAGRGISFHGGVRVVPRPFVGRHIIRHPVRAVRFKHLRHHGFLRRDGFRHHGFLRHHRRHFGDGERGVVTVVYGSSDWLDPTIDAGVGGEPARIGEAEPELLAPSVIQSLAALGRNCRTTVQLVPSERGGKSAVRITRCYPAEDE